ncbi:MAG: zinc-finger domain-containing protein [Gammaproteobacteria bacterium]|nr:zinc-finger domain-containing protein [Gammaproteobacteria bacterium]
MPSAPRPPHPAKTSTVVTTRPREIKIVDDRTEEIGCDGGGGSLGHPRVYLPFEGRRQVDCYYCGQRFAKSGYESPDAQHA